MTITGQVYNLQGEINGNGKWVAIGLLPLH